MEEKDEILIPLLPAMQALVEQMEKVFTEQGEVKDLNGPRGPNSSAERTASHAFKFLKDTLFFLEKQQQQEEE